MLETRKKIPFLLLKKNKKTPPQNTGKLNYKKKELLDHLTECKQMTDI